MQLTFEQFMQEISARVTPLTYAYECFDDQGKQLTSCQSLVTDVKFKPEKNTLSLMGKSEASTWMMQVIEIGTIKCIKKTTGDKAFTYQLFVGHNSYVVLKMDFYH